MENNFYNTEKNNTTKENLTDDIKNMGAISYFLIFSPILYMTRKDSEFIQFHSAQGSVLLIFFIIFWGLASVFSPFKYLNLIVFLGAIVGFIQAIKGEKYQIPFVYDIIKDGFSPTKIYNGIIRGSKIISKIILGFFPKKTGEKITQKLKINPDTLLLKRIENIEKILIIDKFFQPNSSILLSELPQNTRDFFAKSIQELKKYDKNLTIIKEKTFIEISGTFGTFILGGVRSSHSENFSYAILSDFFKKQDNSNNFGGFEIGTKKIDDNFIYPKYTQ